MRMSNVVNPHPLAETSEQQETKLNGTNKEKMIDQQYIQ